MIALTLTKIKFMSRGILFIILLIFFYFLFMEPALQKFTDGATTIVQSQEKNVQPDPPVLVICPDPPFKPSLPSLGTVQAHADCGFSSTMSLMFATQ